MQVTVTGPACGKLVPALELQLNAVGAAMPLSRRPMGSVSVMVSVPLAGKGVGPRLVVDSV